ncbi:MAG: hypothetical protein O3A00_14620 [Planctomycetota bacterium]|nr:hypothetical protein [Planctomycetota bacterium]
MPVTFSHFLLGEWKDQRHTIDAAEFGKAFFSENDYTSTSATGQRVYGSLRDFYDEMSYGQLRVTGKVFDWVELPGTYSDYRDASFGSSVLQDQLLLAIRRKHGADVFNKYDGLALIWAGNTVRRTSALWPMRLTLKEFPGKAAFKMASFIKGKWLRSVWLVMRWDTRSESTTSTGWEPPRIRSDRGA